MKFMVQWRVFPELRHEVLKGFSMMSDSDLQNDLGDKIKLIGRWHDVSRFEGVAICECDDAQAVALETSVVLDDDEIRALGKARFS
jgi:hypothetical protein